MLLATILFSKEPSFTMTELGAAEDQLKQVKDEMKALKDETKKLETRKQTVEDSVTAAQKEYEVIRDDVNAKALYRMWTQVGGPDAPT